MNKLFCYSNTYLIVTDELKNLYICLDINRKLKWRIDEVYINDFYWTPTIIDIVLFAIKSKNRFEKRILL